jgi:hypothetical protein
MQGDRGAHGPGRGGREPDGLGDVIGDMGAGESEIDAVHRPGQAGVVQHRRREQQLTIDVDVRQRAERGTEGVCPVGVIQQGRRQPAASVVFGGRCQR